MSEDIKVTVCAPWTEADEQARKFDEELARLESEWRKTKKLCKARVKDEIKRLDNNISIV